MGTLVKQPTHAELLEAITGDRLALPIIAPLPGYTGDVMIPSRSDYAPVRLRVQVRPDGLELSLEAMGSGYLWHRLVRWALPESWPAQWGPRPAPASDLAIDWSGHG